MTTPNWTKQLADGLVMRGAVPDDADRLADFNARMHREPEYDVDAWWIGEWTRDLLTKPHPTTPPSDIILVEEPANGEIVSSTAYFNQIWSYGGIPIPFGRPEIVSTHPDYRNRGLVRQQFELMHEWGRQRGHLAQGITGIPYYYRQFGYEMALEMPVHHEAQLETMPSWGESEERVIRLRDANRDDLAFIEKTYRSSQSRSLFSVEVNAAELGYQLFDRDKRSALYTDPIIIEKPGGEAIGYLAIKTVLVIEQAEVFRLEFVSASAFRDFTAPTLKALKSYLAEIKDASGKRIKKLTLFLPNTNPVHLHAARTFHGSRRPYAWYIRVPDIGAMLTAIVPALAQRLVGTAHEGRSGEFLLSFYRYGLNLKFEAGRLSAVEQVRWPDRRDANALFPDLTFLQLLCGRKSFAELHDMFVDCSAKSDADADLLETLFPKRESNTAFAIA